MGGKVTFVLGRRTVTDVEAHPILRLVRSHGPNIPEIELFEEISYALVSRGEAHITEAMRPILLDVLVLMATEPGHELSGPQRELLKLVTELSPRQS
jgi:hypothetical protein